MGTKLHVGNLAYTTTEQSLQNLFSEHGTVASCRIIMDRDSGRSKGFGFVEMSSSEEAEKALGNLNGRDIDGREVVISEARPQTERPRSFGGDRNQSSSWEHRSNRRSY